MKKKAKVTVKSFPFLHYHFKTRCNADQVLSTFYLWRRLYDCYYTVLSDKFIQKENRRRDASGSVLLSQQRCFRLEWPGWFPRWGSFGVVQPRSTAGRWPDQLANSWWCQGSPSTQGTQVLYRCGSVPLSYWRRLDTNHLSAKPWTGLNWHFSSPQFPACSSSGRQTPERPKKKGKWQMSSWWKRQHRCQSSTWTSPKRATIIDLLAKSVARGLWCYI